MNKKDLIEQHGNDLVAYDATDTYKPLVLCYWDDEVVLSYNANTGKHNLVKMNYLEKNDDYVFTVNGIRYYMSNFVRVGSMWSSGMPSKLDEWIKENNY